MLKLITRFLRPLGIFLIFVFAATCIFGSIFVRDIDADAPLGKFLYYTVSFESRFYDFRLKANIDRSFKSKEIVLVKIDDYSLEKMGMWPIPRTDHARMLDKLGTFGAKVVAFDVLFPEKSPVYGQVSPDTVFAESIKKFQTKGGRVFLAYTWTTNPGEALPEAPLEMLNDAILTRNVPEADFDPMRINRLTFPIPELLATDAGVGSISTHEDPDGIFRHHSLLGNVDTIYYGSLSYNSFEAFTDKKYLIKIFSDDTGEFELDGKKMEISRKGEVKVRYAGGEAQFDSVSMYDVLQAKDNDQKMKEILKGKIVFIGSTAIGAHDLRDRKSVV